MGIIIGGHQDPCNLLDEESASGVALTGAGSGGCVSAERQQPRLCVLVTSSCFFLFFFLLPVHVAGKVRLAQYRAPESLPEVSLTAIVSPITDGKALCLHVKRGGTALFLAGTERKSTSGL